MSLLSGRSTALPRQAKGLCDMVVDGLLHDIHYLMHRLLPALIVPGPRSRQRRDSIGPMFCWPFRTVVAAEVCPKTGML